MLIFADFYFVVDKLSDNFYQQSTILLSDIKKQHTQDDYFCYTEGSKYFILLTIRT